MAIDSASKRFSMMCFSRYSPLLPPDGTIDQGDRQTFLNKYSGILFDTLTIFSGAQSINNIWLIHRKR